MTSWKKPTQKQIDLVLANLKGNLIQQFFAKLENPEWFEILKEQNLLEYNKNTNDSGQEYIEWTAFPYLCKVASEIPDKIMDFIQPILSEIKESPNPNWWFIEKMISLAIKLPDKEFNKIMVIYNESIQKLDLLGWLDNVVVKQILERLKNVNKFLALAICRNLLSIKLTKDKYSFRESFSPSIKIVNAGYGYEQLIKIINSLFSDFEDDLLHLYVAIVSEDMISGLVKDEIERYYELDWIHRSAIETHVQDLYKKSDPLYILVSEIRDMSFNLIQKRDLKDNQKIFELLENSNCPTMTRIILYLLRISDKYNKDLLIKYLTNKDIFDSSTYHHEYYLLMQEKFSQLSESAQKIILNYIDEGPEGDYYEKDEPQFSAQYKKDIWRLRKLLPIKKFLSPDLLKKYQSILYDENGKEKKYDDHPDMLFWIESGFMASPIDTKDLSEKSIDEIVEFVNSWKADNADISISEIGLAESIRTDAISNPEKYLNQLEKTKEIKDPTYIHYMLSGLRDVEKISNIQWQNIINFGSWVVNQNNIFEGHHRFHDGDNDWHNAKAVVADLLAKAFKHKDNLQDLADEYIDKAFNILKELCFMEDKHLATKVKEENAKDLGDYLTSAINSLHGKSVEGLVLYLIWKKNNDKSLDDVTPIIDRLLKKPSYIETYAIFAHMLPWMHYAIPTVVESNIDNLFPENVGKRHIFEITFATYIDYSKIFDNMFSVLESKFLYALKNQVYSENEQTKTEDSRISDFLVIYYGKGLFDLDSDIIKWLFDGLNNYQKQVEFVNYIGFSMWHRDNPSQIVDQKIIERFTKFWEWLLQYVKGKEAKYKEVLSQFERWYQCNQFDPEWIITRMHGLVVDYDIPIQLFMIEDNLLRDLPCFPRKVFNIISKLICSGQQRLFISNKTFVENIVQYIHEHDFPDDPKLKSDKDVFINKYLENYEGWQVSIETERLSKYLEIK
ncbi:MAG: hypothetical protein IJ660_05820 [Alphaproteobacteria bacterium]|nr:hypothetical protein [Alphaproteobacteria bacterium]